MNEAVVDASTVWDYSTLASHYERRAPYDASAIRAALDDAGISRGAQALDIGAGTGRLSAMLAREGLRVIALEPNDEMRAVGKATTHSYAIDWLKATGESSGIATASVDVVTYGSSFNVLDRRAALAEAARVLRDRGWILLVWNHRDLGDPVQLDIEKIIRRFVPDYSYGSRRDDPTNVIAESYLFRDMRYTEAHFVHHTTIGDFVDGFRAHATLIRQAGSKLPAILDAIAARLRDVGTIDVPFTTRVWYCQRRDR